MQKLLTLFFLSVLCLQANAAEPETALPYSECLSKENDQERLACYDQHAKQEQDVKAVTEALPEGAIRDRVRQELTVGIGDWAITPHGPTYFLPLTYINKPNEQSLESLPESEGESFGNYEAKLQFSFKIPLWINMFGQSSSLYFGYTQMSLWQMYNSEISAPFRETNYEPELMLGFPLTRQFLGMDMNGLLLSFNHQSNGHSRPLSRSWNRVVANLLFSKGDFVVNLRPWYRIPEDENDDDNPDIEQYLGNGEVQVFYKHGDNVFGGMIRNNLREDNKGAVQLDWSYQIHPKVKSYVQLFSGYGESLIDYNHSVTRIGVGIMLNNWI